MIITYFDIRLFLLICKRLTLNENRVLVFFLPAMLYFGVCRYESLAVLFLLLSLLALYQDKFNLAVIFLALSFWTKWYAFLFIPLFIQWDLKKVNLKKWTIRNLFTQFYKQILIFLGISIVMIVPSLFIVSIQNIIGTYIFQSSRESNGEGFGIILVLLNLNIEIVLNFGNAANLQFSPLLIIQFSIFIILFFVRIDSFNDLLLAGSLGVVWFIFFAIFQSPQWILWALPIIFLVKLEKTKPMILICLLILWDFYNVCLLHFFTRYDVHR